MGERTAPQPEENVHGAHDQDTDYEAVTATQDTSGGDVALKQAIPSDPPPVGSINEVYQVPMATREQGINIGQAIKYGFKATFSRPGFWVGRSIFMWMLGFLSLCLFGLFADGIGQGAGVLESDGFAVTPNAGSVSLVLVWLSAFTIAAICFLYLGMTAMPTHRIIAMKQLDGKILRPEDVDDLVDQYWKQSRSTYVLSLLIRVAVACPLMLWLLPQLFGNGVVFLIGLFIPIYSYGILLFVGPTFVVTMLVTAWVSMLFLGPFYAADGRFGGMGPIKESIRLLRRNLSSFLILWLCWVGLTLIPLSVFFLPAMYNSFAFAYRQASGSVYPDI